MGKTPNPVVAGPATGDHDFMVHITKGSGRPNPTVLSSGTQILTLPGLFLLITAVYFFTSYTLGIANKLLYA